ncbi:deoxyadenosine/deoxycytidine kinase [Metamycoplasma subdolum]|uniref:Deoxyadenosine/deoxycytidine kinase n=1 Tax=Metamycoplasma subdolum TaxID=92407 RepID=A0A3M0A203_9BACT|nr:deoxynucleoside kinase [Metamycoplasma subdolum]RMA78656.1 deoxyadenosine/deoxycytidine kinase [Metamycoplasma subdolum]WPB50742.1 deoxynucleoside kinase [Metamycoplasma subdolum]
MIISISGMIGAGKSCFAERLHKHYTTSEILHEFDEEDEVFNTYLNWFYEKKENVEISFQSYMVENYATKFSQKLEEFHKLKKDLKKDHIFLDRLPLELYIFARLSLKNKNKKYLEGYKALFEEVLSKIALPDFAIFLNISFDTFKKRIFERGRESEVNNFEANEDYFKELHKIYLETFKEFATKVNLKYLVIDVDDKNPKEILKEAIDVIESLNSSTVQEFAR